MCDDLTIVNTETGGYPAMMVYSSEDVDKMANLPVGGKAEIDGDIVNNVDGTLYIRRDGRDYTVDQDDL